MVCLRHYYCSKETPLKQLGLFGAAIERDDTKLSFEFPDLTGEKLLGYDTETDGLNSWGKNRPVGLSVATQDGRGWYMPFGHEQGENLDEAKVVAWAKENLRGKTLVGANVPFDVHMSRKIGIDLDELGCKLHDVQHCAALLDSRRGSYDLDVLAKKELGRGKVVLPPGRKIHEMSGAKISQYAITDAVLVVDLLKAYLPKLEREDLMDVFELESDIILPVCEMEHNGLLIDTEKLFRWQREAQLEYQRIVLDLWRLVGFRVEPGKRDSMARLFHKLNLEYEFTEAGMPSFKREDMKAHDEPAVKLLIAALEVSSLKEKYLDKYAEAVSSDGILRFKLNQLKSDEYGTVTGRFSGSGGGRAFKGMNPQQVIKKSRQLKKAPATSAWPIRELFIEDADHDFLSADASQIEFRIFGHYSQNPTVLEAYSNDPNADFHIVVADMCSIDREPAKGINFGLGYGMGRNKMAAQLGVQRKVSDTWVDKYHRMFPEAGALLEKCAKLAETRGWVKTIAGRRRRYRRGEATYSAWNAVAQGTAADIMKMKIRDAYKSRKELQLKMRCTVHDELIGGLPKGDEPAKQKLQEFMDVQAVDLRVPITWSVKTGVNW